MRKPIVISLIVWTDDEGMDKIELQWNMLDVGSVEEVKNFLFRASAISFPEQGEPGIMQRSDPSKVSDA